ncbi:MAG TPA: hypothetical protein VMU45_14270 [Candidatus Eisenbacteria bacterium]|nr:hypothetical protein [Candidatus Eisenbacteria bacterium]
MKAHNRLSIRLLILGLLVSPSLPAAAEHSAASQISAEIARLQQSIKDKPVTDKDAAPIATMAQDALKASAAAANAGQVYLALEKLGQAEDLLQGARTAADKAQVEKGGLPAFQSQWNNASLRLSALDKEAHARQWNDSPLAVRALAEAAQGKAIPLLEGGQGFAVATAPKDGLFYVGQAEGEAHFATFCASLKFAGTQPGFALRSLLPELQALQQKVTAAFQPPQSIELHTRFIALNSQIKLAQELDSTRFYAGALYAYMEATRHYGMLREPPLDAAKQAALKQDLAAERKKLAASSADNSLAQLFIERAESSTAHPDGSAPTADEWRGARVILDQVLPAYYAAQKPTTPLEQASGKTVDITLVRWPYT